MDYKVERPRRGRMSLHTREYMEFVREHINIGDYIEYDKIKNVIYPNGIMKQKRRCRDKIKDIKANYVYFESGDNTRMNCCLLVI